MSTAVYTDDCTDVDDVNINNFQQIKKKVIKIGYANGVSDGRESAFQVGFDQGYLDGLTRSFNLEKYKQFFNHVNTDQIHKNDLAAEKHEYERFAAMNSSLLDDLNQNIDQQEYLEETIRKFESKMPVSTKLLNTPPNTFCL